MKSAPPIESGKKEKLKNDKQQIAAEPASEKAATTYQACNKCQAQLTTGLKFCTECGAALFVPQDTQAVIQTSKVKVEKPNPTAGTDKSQKTNEPVSEPVVTEKSSLAESFTSLPYATLPPKSLSTKPGSKIKPIYLGAGGILAVLILAIILWPKSDNVTRVAETVATPTPPPTHEIINSHEDIAGMAYIQGQASFEMGDPQAKEGDNWPRHGVTIEPFYIDKYEVTQEDYHEYLQKTGGKQLLIIQPGEEKLPVRGVSWDNATDYLKWRGQKTGVEGLRLPYEKEWEFVARDGKNQAYPWGNVFSPGMANAGKDSAKLMPIGSFALGVGEFKVYDLIGNAWEWVADPFYYYDDSKSVSGNQKNRKIIRGGCYGAPEINAYQRYTLAPDWPREKVGFRGAKSAKQ